MPSVEVTTFYDLQALHVFFLLLIIRKLFKAGCQEYKSHIEV